MTSESVRLPSDHLVVLEAGQRSLVREVRELWQYRDLLFFLTWREVSIRYKQTALGILWAVIVPFMTMVVFTVFLGNLAKVPSDGVPYPVFSYLGLLPWTYFAGALTRSGTSLVSNSNLLTKVYFPRLLIPLSATLSALVDFAIAFLVLIGLMAWYRIVPAPSSWLLIPLALLTAFIATGVGMVLSALNVQYRDVQHAVPFVIQLWMFATPVVYPTSLVPERFQALFTLNPMTGLIDAYRDSVLGQPIDWRALGVSCVVAIVVFLVGLWQFRRMERVFADVV